MPCCCKAWRSAVYLCNSLEFLPYRSLSHYYLLLVCILCCLPRDILSLSLKAQRFSVNDLVMSNTTLEGWCQLYTSKRTVRLKELRAMKKKSEKFNICTFCLSKMCKLLGVWAVAWLLSIQVSRFAFRSRGFSKPLLHPAYVFQNMKSFTIWTQLCLKSHYRRVYLCSLFV